MSSLYYKQQQHLLHHHETEQQRREERANTNSTVPPPRPTGRIEEDKQQQYDPAVSRKRALLMRKQLEEHQQQQQQQQQQRDQDLDVIMKQQRYYEEQQQQQQQRRRHRMMLRSYEQLVASIPKTLSPDPKPLSVEEHFETLRMMMLKEVRSYDLNLYFPEEYDDRGGMYYDDAAGGGQNHPHHHRYRRIRPRRQNLIKEEWRTKICMWLFTIVDHYNLPREVVALSMNYFDRFMAASSTCSDTTDLLLDVRTGNAYPNTELARLTSLTVLFLSTKLHFGQTIEHDAFGYPMNGRLYQVPSLDDLSQLSGGNPGQDPFTVETIQSMEELLLSQLQWKLHPPTLHTYIHHLLQILPTIIASSSISTTENSDHHHRRRRRNQHQKQQQHHDDDAAVLVLIEELHATSIFIAEMSICDIFYVDNNIPASIIAFASICISMEDIVIDDNVNTADDEIMDGTTTGQCFLTMHHRNQYIETICHSLGIFPTENHAQMFEQSCGRLRKMYADSQEQQHKQLMTSDNAAAVITTDTAATESTAAKEETPTITPLKDPQNRHHRRRCGSPTNAWDHPPHQHHHRRCGSSPSSNVPSSPTSTVDPMCGELEDAMSMSTINSAMMAHSIADTITIGNTTIAGCTVNSVKRGDSMFSMDRSCNNNNVHTIAGNNGGGSSGIVGPGWSTTINVVNRGESMVSSVLTRGESMASTMSGITNTGSVQLRRGESAVSSISGRHTPWMNDESEDEDNDVGKNFANNLHNHSLRYSPSPPSHEFHPPQEFHPPNDDDRVVLNNNNANNAQDIEVFATAVPTPQAQQQQQQQDQEYTIHHPHHDDDWYAQQQQQQQNHQYQPPQHYTSTAPSSSSSSSMKNGNISSSGRSSARINQTTMSIAAFQ